MMLAAATTTVAAHLNAHIGCHIVQQGCRLNEQVFHTRQGRHGQVVLDGGDWNQRHDDDDDR
jgi:hypothetical protein